MLFHLGLSLLAHAALTTSALVGDRQSAEKNNACECGYAINRTRDNDAPYKVFTNVLETDFIHMDDLNKKIGWRRQEYNVTANVSRGPYGKSFTVSNVVANPLKKRRDWAGESVHGGDAGLQLWVRSQPEDGMVGAAEFGGDRMDIMYGSFRIAAKFSNHTGTCGAFFWYSNDTQEIDMEFLSKEFNDSKSIVNYVIQTPESKAAGFDASNTPYFKRWPLQARPDGAFHEYRFDWLPERVSFFIDGEWQYDLLEGIPKSAGHMVLNHWSNGDKNWSAGPPKSDAVMTVSYVKAYFNSTNTKREQRYAAACQRAVTREPCLVPDLRVAPDNSGPDANNTARTYFFTQDVGKLANQIIYDSSACAVRSTWETVLHVFVVATLVFEVARFLSGV